MKGRAMWLVVCLALISFISVNASVITVYPSDSREDVQTAIWSADTVVFLEGNYLANYVVPEARTLLGAGVEVVNLTFDASGPTGNILSFIGDLSSVSGLSIDGEGANTAIWTQSAISINDVTINNAIVGVLIDSLGELNGGGNLYFNGCHYGINSYGTANLDGGENGIYFQDNWVGIQNNPNGRLTVVHTIFNADSVDVKANGIPGVGIFIKNCIFENTGYNAIDFRLAAEDTIGPGIPFVFSVVNNTAYNISNNFIWLEYVLDPDISNNIIYQFHCGVASNIPITIHSYNCFDFNGMYGDIYWNVEADDTIIADPEFGSLGDFILSGSSPCIDAGNPSSSYNDPDTTRNDIGCYGGPLGWWNGFAGVYDTTSMVVDPDPPFKEAEFSVYPNPSNTMFYFSMPEAGNITIYDVKGRIVWTSNKATHIIWDGTNNNGMPVATGIYFCKTSTGESKRIVLMK